MDFALVWVAQVTVLVTGAGGLVGSELARDQRVTGLNRAALDVTDADAFARALRLHRPSAVINAAAQAGVDRAEREVRLTTEVNAVAPGVMARIAAEEGVRFVHLSTDYVLDAPESDRLDESMIPNPRSTYARTKLDGEAGVLTAGGTVVRLQWVYQPGERGFFNRALAAMRRGEPVRLVTDQVGCPTPAQLLAPALIAIAGAGPVGLFHLATAGEATAFEWIQAGAEAMGVEFRAIPARRADFEGAHRPARSVLDSSKVAAAWGIKLPQWRRALQTVVCGSDRMNAGAVL